MVRPAIALRFTKLSEPASLFGRISIMPVSFRGLARPKGIVRPHSSARDSVRIEGSSSSCESPILGGRLDRKAILGWFVISRLTQYPEPYRSYSDDPAREVET